MKPLTLKLSSFPAYESVIELAIIGRGRNAYLRIGVRRGRGAVETVAGARDNNVVVREFFERAVNRLKVPKRRAVREASKP